MFKRAKVVMLSTNQKAQIGDLGLSLNNVLNFAKNNDWIFLYNPIKQHIYITSDEEIKEDEINNNICVFKSSNGILICLAGKGIGRIKTIGNYYKIIATTDTNLLNPLDHDNALSRPSQQFIEKYISEYNKGNIITNILVEYNIIPFSQDAPNRDRGDGSLRINPKDNTITIKRIKDSWNKEEHIADIYKAMKVLIDTHHLHYEYYQEQLTNWIKENI